MTTTQLFESIVQDLVNAPECAPRGQKVKEILNYSCVIENPRDRIITNPARNVKLSYLLAEWVWYMSGDPMAGPIAEFAPFWKTISDENGVVNSNYGTRIFGTGTHPYFPEINQFENVIDILKNDPDSRQAVMTINSPPDLHPDNKDVPCTFSLQFFIRNGKLDMIVNMRSNDIIMGFCNDIFQFAMIQELVLEALNNNPKRDILFMGKYYHNAGSMHLYERHYKMAESILKIADENNSMTLTPEHHILNGHGININNKFTCPSDAELEILCELMELAAGVKNHQIDLNELRKNIMFNGLSSYWQEMVELCWSDKYVNA